MSRDEIILLANTLKSWTISIVVAGLVFVLLSLVRRSLMKRLKRDQRVDSSQWEWDVLLFDWVKNTKLSFRLTWAVFAGISMHTASVAMEQMTQKAVFLVSLIQIGVWSSSLITFWIERYMKLKLTEDVESATTLGLVSTLAKFALYSMLCLLALNNFGVNITALVAGLGVGGIAVALAVQNILGDLFASLTIVLDKPFVVGDQILAGEHMGSVERIGLKTTRIRSLSGEQLIFPNGDLLKSRIRNFKRMEERRMVFTLHLQYNVPYEKLKEVSKIVREVIQQHPRTRLERCNFKNYGVYSLEIEAVYWSKDPDLNLALNIQEDLLLEVFRIFKEKGIQFAYLTQPQLVQQGASQYADIHHLVQPILSAN